MDGLSTLLADLGKAAAGGPSGLGSPRRSSLLDPQAPPTLPRRSRISSFSVVPRQASSSAASTSKPSPRIPSMPRAPSLLTPPQQALGGSVRRSNAGLSGVNTAAKERWRNLSTAIPRSPSSQASPTIGRRDTQGNVTAEGRRGTVLRSPSREAAQNRQDSVRLSAPASRFAQLVQQVTVPSWMNDSAAQSAGSPPAPRRAPAQSNAASDVLAAINASIDSPGARSAAAQPANSPGAEDILAALEASLQGPGPQSTAASAAAPGFPFAADHLVEIDKLLSPGILSTPSWPVSAPEQASADSGGATTAGQTSSERADIQSASAMLQEPRAAYLDVPAPPQSRLQMTEHWDDWSLSNSVHTPAQDAVMGQLGIFDHRHQHISSLLHKSLLEPASLSELKAAWGSRPVFDPRMATLSSQNYQGANGQYRFEEEAGRLLQSLDAWERAEQEAIQAYAVKVQRRYGL